VEGKDLDSQILDLAERGKKLDAISMVRQKYGYSLAQSKEIVEGLM
jgi:ribosomal protein L7/L12